MKKRLAALLAGMLLLTACGGGSQNEASFPQSADEASFDDGVIDYTLVSVGKPYKTTSKAVDAYPDRYGQQITDGQKVPDNGAHYVDSRMIGYTANTNFQIDLGEDGKRISAISARCLEMSQDGVLLATAARFYASTDGKKFKTLGNVAFESNGDLTVSTARYEFDAAGIADYRYIRVSIAPAPGAHFFFLDEIEVFADVPQKEAAAETVDIAYSQESIDRDAWLDLSTKTEANPIDTENLAYLAEYSFEGCVFDERAPESSELLTDGDRTGRLFSEPVWVGINGAEGGKISLSLNSAKDNIYGIRIHALGSGIGISYPDYIDAFAKSSGDYVFIGRMYAPAKCDNYAYTLLLPEHIGAGDFRFEFPKGNGNYWVEEIEILGGSNEEPQKTLYPELSFPVVTEELRWASAEPDYRKNQNLILGKTQQIAATYYASLPKRDNESEWDSPVLTDGKQASDTYCYNGEYFFARGGDAIDIFFDLEKLSSVNRLTVSTLEQSEWGISRPKFASVFLSENGTDWYEVGSYSRGDAEISVSAQRIFLEFDLKASYAARFVRFRIENGMMFIDELEAFGKKEVDSKTKRLAESGLDSTVYFTNSASAQFATLENTEIKADEIAIVYGNRGELENTLLPFVAYLDKDGNIKDTFMNGFLYCNSGTLPSGSQPHLDNYKQDWEYIYDITFNGKNGLDKLEATVEQVKSALNLIEHRVQVYFTFLTVRESVTDFGDVDGDGISENLSTPEGRKKVIDWFMKMCESEFASRGYKNLEIGGYYWINEGVTWEKDDSAIIKEVADYVHANGSKLLWVPYYKANRYYTGYELGFDMVCMQPNVVFTTDAPLWKFDSTIELTKYRQMCVEIEHTYQALADRNFARSYMLYLYHGAVSGYMDAIHVYYDDIDNYAKLAFSDNPLCRMQYDATYHFAKGDLVITPEVREPLKLETKADTLLRGDLGIGQGLQNYTLLKAPEHGYVSLNSEGRFIYYPEKGFAGSDSFQYTFNEFLGESEPCTVEIKVE